METRVEQVAPMRLIGMAHVGPYHEIGRVWEMFMMGVMARGLKGRFIRVYHDDPMTVAPEKLRSAACVTVGDSVEPWEGVEVIDIVGGKYAVGRHVGEYSKLGDAWAEFCGVLIPKNGWSYRQGVVFEDYVTPHGSCPPEEMVTELYCPIQ